MPPVPVWSRESFRIVENLDISSRRSDENPNHQKRCNGPTDVEEQVLPTQNVNGRLVQQRQITDRQKQAELGRAEFSK